MGGRFRGVRLWANANVHGPGGPGVVDCRRGAAVLSKNGKEVGQRSFHRVPVGTDGPVGAHFSIPALISHGNYDRILVDIEAHEPYSLFHVLVSFVGGFAYSFHHAARLAFREQPALPGTSTFFVCGRPHATIVSRQNFP